MQLLVMKHDTTNHKKGDVIEVRASGTPFVGREPDSFVLIEIPAAPMIDYKNYSASWERGVAFDVVASDLSIDGFRIRLYPTMVNGALGRISVEDVQGFIESWGGVVHSYTPDEVIFDITIFAALSSSAFWEIPSISDNVVFSEIDYNMEAGIHRIEADYTNISNNPSYIERYIENRGLTPISHSNRKIVYEAKRSIVREAFQTSIKDQAKIQVSARRFYISPEAVDVVINSGGVFMTDRATLLSHIKDKVIQ